MVRRLAGPHVGFAVHIDRSADPASALRFRRELDALTTVTYARRVGARWGSYGQALAIMRCIEAALGRMEPFDRYVLLSGQDYPIACQARIVEFFAANPATEYVEAFPQDVMDPDVSWWSPYFRFRRYHLWVGGRHVVLPFVRKAPPPVPIYHGSTWWALTRAAVTYVLEQFESNRELRNYLRTGFLVDEVYVPSLLMASRFASKLAWSNVTFAEWTPTSGPHPKTLQIDDLHALLASPKLFARKFDANVDESLMNELDKRHVR